MKDYSGRLGDLWEHSPGIYWAVEFTKSGSEKLTRGIKESDLHRWVKRLDIPTSPQKQSLYRNDFPTTCEEVLERFETL